MVLCAIVHELYRSSLVCIFIPILKGVFWSKQQSSTVPPSICWNLNYFDGGPMLAMENSSKFPA